MTLTVHGLKNCDSCRKALKDLKAGGLEHAFIDVRADGVERRRIAAWAAAVGWEILLNRRGTTWRGLGDAEKVDIDEAKAVDLMAAHPALIKRPVVEYDGAVTIGLPDAVKNRLA